MQFAGQRTDMMLNPIGEPHNVLIKMTDDVLPEPDAILITGITPQQTVIDGVTEASFLRQFYEEIATPGTIFVGFNSVRFDDEFMRYLMWRNFYDPYEWQWKQNRSRWDLLDVVRMTRALRPEGMHWPFASDGRPTNRLELLTNLNKLEHKSAHDALSDVHATIAVARLIRAKQPKLFEFLLKLRDKKEVANIAERGQPFVYTSGKYASEFEKTTVVLRLGDNPKKQGALVYDLRYDPDEFLLLSVPELIARWQWTRDEDAPHRLPVKTLQYNRCPAIAPLSVLDDKTKQRLSINDDVVQQNTEKLTTNKEFLGRIYQALELMNQRQQTSFVVDPRDVDATLYDDFIPDKDKPLLAQVQKANEHTIADTNPSFTDKRLETLLPLYKARNYPKYLSDQERTAWEEFCTYRLTHGGDKSRLARFAKRLSELADTDNLSQHKRYLLEELQLWAESIVPVID